MAKGVIADELVATYEEDGYILVKGMLNPKKLVCSPEHRGKTECLISVPLARVTAKAARFVFRCGTIRQTRSTA